MAFTRSDWGYTDATVLEPDTNTYSRSAWAYAPATLADPSTAGGLVRSKWAFVSATLRNPHKPIMVKTGPSTWKAAPILSFNGTVWR